ncbi:hypothetical protein Aduo_012772 [Ancylostoma duodenale]
MVYTSTGCVPCLLTCHFPLYVAGCLPLGDTTGTQGCGVYGGGERLVLGKLVLEAKIESAVGAWEEGAGECRGEAGVKVSVIKDDNAESTQKLEDAEDCSMKLVDACEHGGAEE